MEHLAKKLAARWRSSFGLSHGHRDLEPINGRPRGMVGLFALLTPEQKAAALSYRGEENHGDKAFLRKR